VEKQPIEEVSKLTNSTDNTCELKPTSMMASVRKIDEYARSEVEMELELMPGESRGYMEVPRSGEVVQAGQGSGQDQQWESRTALRFWRRSLDCRHRYCS